ncbi:hypothetical protein G6L37_02055 [Agrobacterium rubi]|nr:hypothetical protein [Agrobacterium rubi]NTF24177.1 hypothetical protein [Agrobacterium rubi]
MKKVFENPEDMSEYLFRIIDNCGSTADRYTVVFCDGSYINMSGSPTNPQGVSMADEDIDPQFLSEQVENGDAVDLALGDLPKHIVDHILFRNNEGLEDFLEAVEKKEPHAVAASRDAAEANEGGHDTLGKGIYMSGEDYMVKMEGGPDDRGPFTTAREAILATMPDDYGFCGSEYHPEVNVMRMTPDPDVLDAIAKLEAKRDAEWTADMNRRYP